MEEKSETPPTQPWLKKLNRVWHLALKAWPILLMFLVAVGTILAYNLLFPPPTPLTEQQVNQLALEAVASATPPPENAAVVYNFILPSLVLIQTENEDAVDGSGGSIGTGVVVNEDAAILTAFHVVADATAINIIFADGTEAAAIVSTFDATTDTAVLQPSRLPEILIPATLGNSNAMRIGDAAYAVGNPFGLAASMSSGVISGFDRSIPLAETGERLEGLIQFDTAVNPGNSGGPLLNKNGQVIGIVTALANPSEQNFFIGIGFAVPISTAGGTAGAPNY